MLPVTSLTPASCPACGGRLEPWALDSGLSLLRCASCGSAAAAEAPPAEETAYRQPGARRLALPVRAALALGIRDELRAIGRLQPASRILDLGAGDGRLAAALAQRGHRVTAVEPFRDVAAAGGAVTVLRSEIDEVELPDGSFDVVLLWHVLEHLPDPQTTLERARPWLADGGRLVVAVPNLASWQARIGGARWFHLDPQRHLVHYTPAGLTSLLRRAGYSAVRTKRVLADQALPGMWMTLLDRAAPAGALRRFVRHEPVRGLDVLVAGAVAAPALLVAAPLELAAAALGQGGAIVAEGRR